MPYGTDDTPLAMAAAIVIGVLYVHLVLAAIDIRSGYVRSTSVRFLTPMLAIVWGSPTLALVWMLAQLVFAPGSTAPVP